MTKSRERKREMMEDIFFSTTIIKTNISENPTFGTGFFYTKNDNSYLVTNLHNVVGDSLRVEDLPTKFSIVLTAKSKGGKIDLLKNSEIPITIENGEKQNWGILDQSTYLVDQDERIDLIVFKLPGYIQDRFEIFSYDSTMEPNIKSKDISEVPNLTSDLRLMGIGYPKGIYDDANNLPILRSCFFASNFYVPFKGKHYFLVEGRLEGGMSGCPIVIHPNIVKNISSIINTSLKNPIKPILLGINCGYVPFYDEDYDSEDNLQHICKIIRPELIEAIIEDIESLYTDK